MKRILYLIVLLVLAAGAYWVWPRAHELALAPHSAPVPAPVAANHDARALTSAEQAAFLPLVCGGASAGTEGFAHDCTSLPGYPSADYGGAGTGLGISLSSVVIGHLSSPTADEAYVSYEGSFEPHVNNFGGGILFAANGKGGWTLEKWVPGAALDGCLSLNPQGRAKMLCLRGSSGQGETDTALVVLNIPDTTGPTVLNASDLRETLNPNANCGLRRSVDQEVLLGIKSIARSDEGYVAQIDYVPAAVAEAACKVKKFGSAPVSQAELHLRWDGQALHITPIRNFAPAS